MAKGDAKKEQGAERVPANEEERRAASRARVAASQSESEVNRAQWGSDVTENKRGGNADKQTRDKFGRETWKDALTKEAKEEADKLHRSGLKAAEEAANDPPDRGGRRGRGQGR